MTTLLPASGNGSNQVHHCTDNIEIEELEDYDSPEGLLRLSSVRCHGCDFHGQAVMVQDEFANGVVPADAITFGTDVSATEV